MSDNVNLNMNDFLSFADKSNSDMPHLRGVVEISRENEITGEREFLERSTNIIPISGYQWILMKMFDLFLDSTHQNTYREDIGKDTNLVIPDLNNASTMKIGVEPANYSVMGSNIASTHFVQGFMIGDGGAGEDSITSKNTNYSFINLRNPIPFQQTQQSLGADVAGQYLGALQVSSTSSTKSYYIKKFDERPHIYHSWWRDGQRWDYVDPITQDDLGPGEDVAPGKTNRIETYVECKMSLSNDDCLSYFSHNGSTATGKINELGLVAYDAVLGARSMAENIYNDNIKEVIDIIFNNDRDAYAAYDRLVNALLSTIVLFYTSSSLASANVQNFASCNHPNINAFKETMKSLYADVKNVDIGPTKIDYEKYQKELSDENNIGVEAFYNQNGTFVYATDHYLEYLKSSEFDALTTDEAERIKLVTYYTFNSIPLQENWKILINYRIYAN